MPAICLYAVRVQQNARRQSSHLAALDSANCELHGCRREATEGCRAVTRRMQPQIAILGWGSLLWEGGADFDRQHEDWQFDGPTLRLEFSRISTSRLGALTLVIDPQHGSPATIAWCLSKRERPDDAIGRPETS